MPRLIFLLPLVLLVACPSADDDGDGWTVNEGDCDDADSEVHPGHSEECNSIDDDCDGSVDENLDQFSWFPDLDGDGFGDGESSPVSACGGTDAEATNGTDCDDEDAGINPLAEEICDGVDQDCDGLVDEGLPTEDWYPDVDGDGYGNSLASPVSDCGAPDGYVLDSSDCDDEAEAVQPGATEECNGIDDNCDGATDEGLPTQPWYPDGDGDGYGAEGSFPVEACAAPEGFAATDDDCNDVTDLVHPDATETCNGGDEDCDGTIDEGWPTQDWYVDSDGDGFGDEDDTPWVTCQTPSGYSLDATDCNDSDGTIHPGSGCDWVFYGQSPGAAELNLYSATDNTVTISTDLGTSTVVLAAGEVDSNTVLSSGIFTARGPEPFVGFMVSPTIGGDQALLTRSTADGTAMGLELVLWASQWIVLLNPGSSDATADLEQWDGGAWVALGTELVPARSAVSVEAPAWGMYRVTTTQELWGYGASFEAPQNSFLFVPADNGTMAGQDFVWMAPSVPSVSDLVGQCLAISGCSYEVFEDSVSVASGAVNRGGSFVVPVTAGSFYEVATVGASQLRHEATPEGLLALNGAVRDAALCPARGGATLSTQFMVLAALGAAEDDFNLRTDLFLLGYVDGTQVTMEELVDGIWTALPTVTVDEAQRLEWELNLEPGRIISMVATEPIQVLLAHSDSEFATSFASDWYAD